MTERELDKLAEYQDEDAIRASSERLSEYADRVTLVHANYAEFKTVLKRLGIEELDGILLDLGVSSHQFDEA